MKKSLPEKLHEVRETTDVNLLKKYMMDASWQVRLAVAKHAKVTQEIKDYLSTDYSNTVKYAVIGDPQILLQTLRMNDEKVLYGKGASVINRNGIKVIPDDEKSFIFDEDEIYEELPF